MPLLIGTGMAASNSIAVFQGLTTKGGSRFGRTPKFNVVRASDRWEGNRYRLPVPPLVIIESLLALYCFGGVWQLLGAGRHLIALSSLYYGASFALHAGVRMSVQAGTPAAVVSRGAPAEHLLSPDSSLAQGVAEAPSGHWPFSASTP